MLGPKHLFLARQGREWFKPLKDACGAELKKKKFSRKKAEGRMLLHVIVTEIGIWKALFCFS